MSYLGCNQILFEKQIYSFLYINFSPDKDIVLCKSMYYLGILNVFIGFHEIFG